MNIMDNIPGRRGLPGGFLCWRRRQFVKMRLSSYLTVAAGLFVSLTPSILAQDNEPDFFQYIDPLIGTVNGGMWHQNLECPSFP